MKSWEPHERLPVVSVRDLFTRLLDITTPPTTILLQYLAKTCENDDEQRQLHLLATVSFVMFCQLLNVIRVGDDLKLFCRTQERTKTGVTFFFQHYPKSWINSRQPDQVRPCWQHCCHLYSQDFIPFLHRLLLILKDCI